MKKRFSKHHSLLLLGAIGCVVALIVNNSLSGDQLALAQMALWTVLVFAFMAIQMHKSLLRPRQLCVALMLLCLHIIGLLNSKTIFR